MSHQIIWSKKAYDTFVKQLEFVEEQWGSPIANRFKAKVEYTLGILSQSPERWPMYSESKQLRKCVLHPNVSLFYKVSGRKVYLVLFHGNRQDPERIK